MEVDYDSEGSIEAPEYDDIDADNQPQMEIVGAARSKTPDDVENSRIKRLFRVLMNDYDNEEFEQVFLSAYLRNSENISNADISKEQAFELSQDHSDNFCMSEIKFRFYANICLIEEALQDCRPIIEKQQPRVVDYEKKKAFVFECTEKEIKDRLSYECPLYVIDTDYLEGKSNRRIVFNAKLQSAENNELLLTFDKKIIPDSDKTYAVFLQLINQGYKDLQDAIDRIKNSTNLQKKLFGERMINGDLAWFKDQRMIEVPQIFKNQQDLNLLQRRAVYSMLKMSGTNPFLLFGPPGTGKTRTLVYAIKYGLINDPHNRFLVCAHSNSAADNFALALLNANFLAQSKIHRFMSSRHDYDERNKKLDGIINVKDGRYVINERKSYYMKFTVIISTIGCVSRLHLDKGAFSYIFIDEAGQATEPDSWIPLAKFGKEETKFVLAGDPLQLGPVLISPVLADPRYRYDQSLLLRLYEQEIYRKDCRLMIQLCENYRSHESIVQTASVLFYDNTLIPTYPEHHDSFISSTIVNEARIDFPIIFHAVQGKEEGYGEFSNEAEIGVVERYVKKLLNTRSYPRLNPADIGIVSPYKDQARKISQRLKCYRGLTVDTVERFQGSERRVIIMTTTRTRFIGFLKDQRRLNTAITRAKHLLIIVGDPLLLRKDDAWNELISCFLENDCLIVEPGHFDDVDWLKNRSKRAVRHTFVQ
uniref:Helicase ATP-binding domain-containing protein n=1 Tax=Panagrolaimus sp. JU765 TaxID=591449 RepID=A0AC34Q7E1_9BILA